MKTELKDIKAQLESTLDGFKDAYENYGYDLANEKYYVETALKKVNLLLLHDVGSNEVKCCSCDYPIVRNDGNIDYCGNCGDDLE